MCMWEAIMGLRRLLITKSKNKKDSKADGGGPMEVALDRYVQ